MKAVVCEAFGRPEVLALCEAPDERLRCLAWDTAGLDSRFAVPDRSDAGGGRFHQMAVARGRRPSAFSSASTLPRSATRIRQGNKL
jgi:hypothetical protein